MSEATTADRTADHITHVACDAPVVWAATDGPNDPDAYGNRREYFECAACGESGYLLFASFNATQLSRGFEFAEPAADARAPPSTGRFTTGCCGVRAEVTDYHTAPGWPGVNYDKMLVVNVVCPDCGAPGTYTNDDRDHSARLGCLAAPEPDECYDAAIERAVAEDATGAW